MYLRTLIALCLISQSLEVTNYISHIQNYVNLVSAYSVDGFSTVDFPPLADVSKPMVVNINIHLFAINGFDEVAGNIELVVALEMTWIDEMSIIHSVAFKIEDRPEFLVPYNLIWTPKLVLTNAIGETSGVGDSVYLCRFDMRTKQIKWKPRVVVSSSCTPDVTYYPFDRQTCEFIYTAWGFRADEIFLTTSGDEWNKDEYGESGEWNIAATSTQTYEAGDQSYIKFTLNIVRKPLYFAFNILLPVLVLCLLNSTVFLLPAESGERVGFSVTCFLSFMVLLNMIMDIMPRSSSPISFLCYYLVVMMSNSGAMTLVTILLMRVYHKPEKSEVPKWLQRCVTFVNCGCAKLRCCVMCCRAIRRKCGCMEKGKCGCARSENKSKQDETLVEVTVKDNKVTERSVKKNLIKGDKKDKRSISKRCTCFSFCSKSNDESETGEQGTKQKKKNKLLNCLSCIRNNRDSKEVRHGIDHQDIETNDNDCGRKNVKVENINGTISNTAVIMNENEIIDKSKCFCINLRKRKANKEKVKADNSKHVAENLPTTNGDIYSEKLARNNIEKCKGSHQEQTESNSSTDSKCFSFLRRSKVSTTDVVDIDNDILPPVKQGNESTKFNKSLNDANTTKDGTNLLNGWDGAKNEDRNKKRTTLDPIETEVDIEKPKSNVKVEEKLDNIDIEKGISGQTQSIENSTKETKIKQRKFSDEETSDEETLRETLRSLRSSRRKSSLGMKQSKKKPDVNRRKSTIGVREIELLRRSLRPSDDIILDQFMSDYPSEEDEVDSLADIEEEVSWPEVGRILDTFFLLVFSGGQAFFTVVFLVPLFTAPNSTTE